MKHKKLIIIFLCIVAFILSLVGINYISDSDKEKFAVYDIDASDSAHYNLNEDVKINNKTLKLIDYQLLQITHVKEWELNIELSDTTYQMLHDKYSFQLAKDDQLLLKSACSYRNGKIFVVDMLIDENRDFNQIVLINNKDYKIIATINLNRNN